jgi:hypothetical protein
MKGPSAFGQNGLIAGITLGISWAAFAQVEPLQVPLDSDPFAIKGEVAVTHAELDAYLDRIPEKHRGGFLRSNERLGQVLDDMILIRLLANEGIDDGLLERPKVQGGLHQTAKVFLAEQYREEYLAEHMLDDYDQQARELYLTEPELFETPRKFTFSHILIERGGDRGELEAINRIQAVYSKLQDGADFDSLVAEYSEDPNAGDNQGQYRTVSTEELEQTVAVALQVLEPGQISEPVFSGHGWHILRLDEEHAPQTRDWETAQAEAVEIARNRHRNRLLETLYRKLLSSADLRIEPGAVEELMQRYGVSDPERPTDQSLGEQTRDQDADPEG